MGPIKGAAIQFDFYSTSEKNSDFVAKKRPGSKPGLFTVFTASY